MIAGNVPASGPPRLVPPRTLSHTPAVTRQKMIDALYSQFLQIYTPGVLPSSRRQQLAAEHALRQEEHLFSRATKATYRNSVISALARLKKRPPARSADETGTLEDDASRLAVLAEKEKGRLTRKRVEGFLPSVDVLRQFDYVTQVPDGVGGDKVSEDGNTRKCERCKREFVVVSNLSPADREACQYHFGRMITEKTAGVRQRVYSCCPSVGAAPCQVGPHVFKDEEPSVLHARVPFVPTSSLRASKPTASGSSSDTLSPAVDIVALDCELIYTTAGMSLARVTVLSGSGAVLLDEHVRPPAGVAILDLNTRFSGVQEGDLEKAVLDVAGVQRALAQFVDKETVFVGHGLENDLKALRLVHSRVIDTAILFPHPNGGTWRHSLRNLTKDVLRKFIQEGDPTVGHSAKDDAEAALELVRHKVKQRAAGKA
ncbi:RNA exonuclease 3 [Rhodotorula sphaerocarpa]